MSATARNRLPKTRLLPSKIYSLAHFRHRTPGSDRRRPARHPYAAVSPIVSVVNALRPGIRPLRTGQPPLLAPGGQQSLREIQPLAEIHQFLPHGIDVVGQRHVGVAQLIELATDPVAADSVMWDFINWQAPRTDHNVLSDAASRGQGVHDRWNNPTDKSYANIDFVQVDMNNLPGIAPSRLDLDRKIRDSKAGSATEQEVKDLINEYMETP